MINVIWGLLNLAIGYLLICRVGVFGLRKNQHIFVFGAGFVLMAISLSHSFCRFRGR
jgi:hypothetical membrane protein